MSIKRNVIHQTAVSGNKAVTTYTYTPIIFFITTKMLSHTTSGELEMSTKQYTNLTNLEFSEKSLKELNKLESEKDVTTNSVSKLHILAYSYIGDVTGYYFAKSLNDYLLAGINKSDIYNCIRVFKLMIKAYENKSSENIKSETFKGEPDFKINEYNLLIASLYYLIDDDKYKEYLDRFELKYYDKNDINISLFQVVDALYSELNNINIKGDIKFYNTGENFFILAISSIKDQIKYENVNSESDVDNGYTRVILREMVKSFYVYIFNYCNEPGVLFLGSLYLSLVSKNYLCNVHVIENEEK